MAKAVKNVVILGSTGSIGINTLEVIARYPKHFRVVGLTAFNNLELLESQSRRFKPKYLAVGEKNRPRLKDAAGVRNITIYDVETGLAELVANVDVDIVVIGMSGRGALEPFLTAVQKGKRVAPANKEALVIAGDILMKAAREHAAEVIPIDSEQSAIFQCLQGQPRQDLKKVYLTASGGALHHVPEREFGRITVEKILAHPRWKMGKKITVDSATLMNKGFEIIEAQRLFGLTVDQIEVVIHPEAIIHSMVGFRDGSVIAQLGITDMRLPIQYALTYPDRWDGGWPEVDFSAIGQLTFARPDLAKFPSLGLAMDVARKGGTQPSVLNAADEEAVAAFLRGALPFTAIFRVVERVLSRHQTIRRPGLKAILEADRWAREEAQAVIAEF